MGHRVEMSPVRHVSNGSLVEEKTLKSGNCDFLVNSE